MSTRNSGKTLKPKGYRPRIIDGQIERLLGIFGAVEVRGTKWCGKTWSSLAAAKSVIHIDLPSILPVVSADSALTLEGESPHLIDEWQVVPEIWDLVRHAVDAAGNEQGLFILTGSSTPEKNKIHHSGAGRIARLDMSTMSLFESGESSGQISLGGLFSRNFTPAPTEEKGLAFYTKKICSGGWPAALHTDSFAAAEMAGQYLEAFFEVSVPKKGGVSRTARKIAASLARNIATAATLNTLAEDTVKEEENRAANSTVSFYLDLFKTLYFIDELPGWDAPIRSKSRLRSKPKRYFADPSLAASLLGVDSGRLLTDGQLLGLLFEALCIHDLRVYVANLPNATRDSLRYYQDADGLEVDVIIELSNGEWAGIEIKLGEDKVPDATKNLNRLRRKIAANPAARNPQPAFMAVIIATTAFARYDKRNDVYIFPLNVLGP